MTRLPLDDRNVTGADGPDYQMNLVCPVPGCGLQATEAHHIFRRSFLSGDYKWVKMPDGSHVGNLVKLCNQHHHMVTINAAWLKLEEWVFTWSDMVNAGQPLLWQPPWEPNLDEVLGERPGVDVLGDLDGEVDQPHSKDQANNGSDGTPLGGHDETLPGFVVSKSVGENQPDPDTCPTCLRPLPHKREHEPKRLRRTWSITVPRDEREDGAETLDNQLEEARQAMARAGLPYGDESSVKFFVLSQALGLFVTHADDVLS